MRRACVSFLSLVLVFICGACSPSVQTSAPPSSTSSLKDVEDVAEVKDVEEAATELTDIFPDLNAVTKVELSAGYTAGRFAAEGVYVNTTEAQATQIIELLSAIDISDFEACGREEIGGIGYRLRLETASESRIIQIISPTFDAETGDILYIYFPVYCEDNCIENGSEEELKACEERILRETLWFKGPYGTFSASLINDAFDAVLFDRTDLPNIGFAYAIIDGELHQTEVDIAKMQCATVRNILDGTIATTEAYDNADDLTFNVMFVVADAVYMLDTTSGYFSREQGDEVVICRLEDSWIRRVYAPLGVLGLING